MDIAGIDHVNILTSDLEASAAFYANVLGLERTPNPALRDGRNGCWMRDDAGRALIHLVEQNGHPKDYAGHTPGLSTNGFHHVALACRGYEETCATLDRLGIAYSSSHFEDIGLRQIFLPDPSGVNLELNFASG